MRTGLGFAESRANGDVCVMFTQDAAPGYVIIGLSCSGKRQSRAQPVFDHIISFTGQQYYFYISRLADSPLRLADKSNGWKITNVSSSHCYVCVSISCGGKRRKNGRW